MKSFLAGLFLTAALVALSSPARAEMACCKAGGEKKSCCATGDCCETGNASFFTATRCGMCAEHKAMKKTDHTADHPGHGGKAKMACCIYVPCHEVGNRGFFTPTQMPGCCSAVGKCDQGSCCAMHGKGGEHHH
jgi:hypothetical protein